MDFSCKSVTVLSRVESVTIPPRSANGVCYAVKLFDAIAVSDSSLSAGRDVEVLARNHDGGSWAANPHSMGRASINISLQGPRTAKLSSSVSGDDPILTDNFFLIGLFAHGAAHDAAHSPSGYHAYGSRDSTIDGSQAHIQMNGVSVPLTATVPFGAATLAPMEVIEDSTEKNDYWLDVRALDSGGKRQLSDVYLIFQ